MNNLRSPRFWSIDLIRGLSVIGMIVFHVFFLLDYFHIVKNSMNVGVWHVFARAVQFSFLGLVGVSLAFSSKKYKTQFFRGLFIFMCGMILTLVTFLIIPQKFITFGILHLIGVSVILLAPLSHKKYLTLGLGIFSFALGAIFKNILVKIPFFAFFGFQTIPPVFSIDFFPLFPWISTVLFGIFSGNILKPVLLSFHKDHATVPRFSSPLLFLGKHSLVIYLIHVPIIFVLLLVLQMVPLI